MIQMLILNLIKLQFQSLVLFKESVLVLGLYCDLDFNGSFVEVFLPGGVSLVTFIAQGVGKRTLHTVCPHSVMLLLSCMG